MATKGIKIVFGTSEFGPDRAFKDKAAVSTMLDAVAANGITTIDTAQVYGGGWSEQVIGECSAGERFTIDTKFFKKGHGTEEGILETGLESLKKLQVEQVDIYYLHAVFTPLSLARKTTD